MPEDSDQNKKDREEADIAVVQPVATTMVGSEATIELSEAGTPRGSEESSEAGTPRGSEELSEAGTPRGFEESSEAGTPRGSERASLGVMGLADKEEAQKLTKEELNVFFNLTFAEIMQGIGAQYYWPMMQGIGAQYYMPMQPMMMQPMGAPTYPPGYNPAIGMQYPPQGGQVMPPVPEGSQSKSQGTSERDADATLPKQNQVLPNELSKLDPKLIMIGLGLSLLAGPLLGAPVAAVLFTIVTGAVMTQLVANARRPTHKMINSSEVPRFHVNGKSSDILQGMSKLREELERGQEKLGQAALQEKVAMRNSDEVSSVRSDDEASSVVSSISQASKESNLTVDNVTRHARRGRKNQIVDAQELLLGGSDTSSTSDDLPSARTLNDLPSARTLDDLPSARTLRTARTQVSAASSESVVSNLGSIAALAGVRQSNVSSVSTPTQRRDSPASGRRAAPARSSRQGR